MAILLTNNASSRLKIDHGPSDVFITVRDGEGSRFAAPTGGDFFMLTLEDRRTGQIEITKCTARTGDVLTVVRAQEGTTAQGFYAGATCSNRLTAGSIASLVGVTEAPVNGNIYGRMNGGWTQTITKTAYDAQIAVLVGVNNTQNTAINNINADINALEAEQIVQNNDILANASDITDLQADIVRIDGVDATQNGNIATNTADIDAIETYQGLQDAAIALKAPIASPTFTGNPQAPTPAGGDNDTSVATTAFVQGELANYAPLASPALTGNPTAPTPAPNDNDNSIATTAYVQGEIADRLTDAPSDGFVYGRKDGAWSTVIGGASTDDAPPAGPLQDGQLWYKSSTGQLFIWYVDIDGGQWVEVGNGGVIPVPTALQNNYCINPDMNISQQNGSASGTSDGYHAADQWPMYFLSGATLTAQRVAAPTPRGSPFRIRMTVTVADATITNDYAYFQQPIEGNDWADFKWGTANADQAVVEFLWKGPAGNFALCVRNGAFNRSITIPFTVQPGDANTDKYITLVVPGDTAGTWTTDTSLGVTFSWVIAAGVHAAATGVWAAGSTPGYSGITNGTGTVSNVFELGDVGIYRDPDKTGRAPKWKAPNATLELVKSMRFWQPLCMDMGITASITGFIYAMQIMFPVPMRVAPTLATFATGSLSNVATAQFDTPLYNKCRAVITATAAGAMAITNRTGAANARF